MKTPNIISVDQNFKIKDLGNLRYFLSSKITRNSKGILINKDQYYLEILEDNGNHVFKHFLTLYNTSLNLYNDSFNVYPHETSSRYLLVI